MGIAEIKNILIFITLFLIAWIFLEAIKVTVAISSIPSPKPPELSLSDSTDIQGAKSKEIENYKNLINAMQSRRISIYENVVLKTLLPIFTSLIAAVLAYIFADKTLQAFKIYFDKKFSKHDGT